MFNNTRNKKNNFKTPMELFSGSKVAFNPKHAHTFGCPDYVLDNEMQKDANLTSGLNDGELESSWVIPHNMHNQFHLFYH